MCTDSLTLNEEWIRNVLSETVCENDIYNEEIIRNKVERILVFCENLEVCCKDGSNLVLNFYSTR